MKKDEGLLRKIKYYGLYGLTETRLSGIMRVISDEKQTLYERLDDDGNYWMEDFELSRHLQGYSDEAKELTESEAEKHIKEMQKERGIIGDESVIDLKSYSVGDIAVLAPWVLRKLKSYKFYNVCKNVNHQKECCLATMQPMDIIILKKYKIKGLEKYFPSAYVFNRYESFNQGVYEKYRCIYLLMNPNKRVIYVGSTDDLYRRLSDHLISTPERLSWLEYIGIISYHIPGRRSYKNVKDGMARFEHDLIRFYDPPLNTLGLDYEQGGWLLRHKREILEVLKDGGENNTTQK